MKHDASAPYCEEGEAPGEPQQDYDAESSAQARDDCDTSWFVQFLRVHDP